MSTNLFCFCLDLFKGNRLCVLILVICFGEVWICGAHKNDWCIRSIAVAFRVPHGTQAFNCFVFQCAETRCVIK